VARLLVLSDNEDIYQIAIRVQTYTIFYILPPFFFKCHFQILTPDYRSVFLHLYVLLYPYFNLTIYSYFFYTLSLSNELNMLSFSRKNNC